MVGKGKRTKMEWNESLKETIKKELNAKGISQRDFVKSVGIDEANFSKYLKGDKVPRADTLIKIAKGLDCSLDYLLGLSKAKYVEPTEDDKAILKVSELTGLEIETIEKLIDGINNCKKYAMNENVETKKDNYTGLPIYLEYGLYKDGQDSKNKLLATDFFYLVNFLNVYIKNYAEITKDYYVPLFDNLYKFLTVGNECYEFDFVFGNLQTYTLNELGDEEPLGSYPIHANVIKAQMTDDIKESLKRLIIYFAQKNGNDGLIMFD